jgi:hypothetical protein
LDWAAGYSGGGTLYKIKIPKGKHALLYAMIHGSFPEGEYEVILPTNTVLNVKSIGKRKVGDTTKTLRTLDVVEMTVASQTGYQPQEYVPKKPVPELEEMKPPGKINSKVNILYEIKTKGTKEEREQREYFQRKKAISDLKLAALAGNLGKVKKILDSGLPVDATNNEFDHPALYVAVQRGRPEIVRELVSRGANINKNDGYTTPYKMAKGSILRKDIFEMFENHKKATDKKSPQKTHVPHLEKMKSPGKIIPKANKSQEIRDKKKAPQKKLGFFKRLFKK